MSVTFDTYPLFSNARWNGWTKLKPQSEVSKGDILDKAENKPGHYRIRHSKFSRLVYIGESAEVRRRMSTLANEIEQDVMPYRDPHTAAMSLWCYKNEYGGDFEVSWIEPESADRNRARVHPRSSWHNYTNPLSKTCMGYHWSKKYNLKNRNSVSCSSNVVYWLTKKQMTRYSTSEKHPISGVE